MSDTLRPANADVAGTLQKEGQAARSKEEMPSGQKALGQQEAPEQQTSMQSVQGRPGKAAMASASDDKRGLTKNAEGQGSLLFDETAGADAKGGHHGGGSLFGNQPSQQQQQAKNIRHGGAHAGPASSTAHPQQPAQPPNFAVHPNREHADRSFFHGGEKGAARSPDGLQNQHASYRQDFKSPEQIEQEARMKGAAMSQNEMLAAARKNAGVDLVQHLQAPGMGPQQQALMKKILTEKQNTPQKQMFNQHGPVRAAGFDGAQVGFAKEQTHGPLGGNMAQAKGATTRVSQLKYGARQMQPVSRERGGAAKAQSTGGSPARKERAEQVPTEQNVFTQMTIPGHQISSRALKLLRGEYAQSYNTIDPRPEGRRQQDPSQGYQTKKHEVKKYFDELTARPAQKISTVVPSALGQSPLKPAPIFRQASIWKNLKDKAALMQQIEEATIMQNKHYQKSPKLVNDNDSAFMSDTAHKQSLKEASWNDQSTSVGQVNTHFTARLAEKSKQSPTDRSHLLDGAPTINTLRSNNETAFEASAMKPDGQLADASIFQPASSKEYHIADTGQPSSIIGLPSSFLGQPSADELQQRPQQHQGMNKMNQDSARGSATFGQGQSSLWQDGEGRRTPLNASQELEALHMYDSLLLGSTISQVQLKKQSERKRMMNFSIHSLRQASEIDWAAHAASHRGDYALKVQNFQDKRNMDSRLKQNLERQFRRTSKLLQPIKSGSQHLEKRHQSLFQHQQQYHTIDNNVNRDAANITDSSAHSNVNVLDLGHLELETIKGTNIRQLSPITRQLNKLTGATLDQLEARIQALSIKKELKDNLLMRLQQKGVFVEDSKTLIEKNTKLVKILKNQISTLVAPDEDKYQVILPNCNFETVEVLPQMIPTYLKIPCSLLRSPCQFEVHMNDLDAMHVMMSTEHKFPQEDKAQFEKEKLVLKDMSLLMKIGQRSQSKEADQKKKKMSILLIEASSKPKKEDEVKMLKQADGTQVPAPIKRTFRFAKPNFKENFDDGDFLYVTLVSQNGGTIRLKVNFPSSQGGFGDTTNTNEETKAAKRKKDAGKETQTPTSVEAELQAWFKDNMHMLDSCKHLFQEGALDFVALNKGARLEMCSYKNLALEHQRKMWANQMKMDAAKQKAEQNMLYKYYKNKKNLTKWEDYRETKIELTAILIRVLKRKNFTRKWLRIHKAGQIYAKVRENLYIRRYLNHILFTSLKCAIRFKIDYKYRYQKQYGFSMVKRNQNLIRRVLNFGAVSKHNTIVDDVKSNLCGFIFNTFLCFNLSQQFTRFNDNLIYLQVQRRHLVMTREYRFLLVYKRMEIIRDTLVPIYNKKKTKKYAKKITQGLKKVMDRGRTEDYKKVKEQFGLWGTKTMKENQNLLDSIRIRTLTITYQVLALSTRKNDEGEKVHKAEIENIKTEIEGWLKKVRLRTKQIDEIDRDLVGISEKEIKEINKKAGGRKPDPKIVKDAAYHKFDTSKIFKDDKLLKSLKTGFMTALTKPKNAPSKRTKGKKGKTAPADEAGGGQPAEDGDGADGMEAGDAEAEGAEGAEGEGAEGEGAEGDGMDAEAAEGDGEAGDGEGAPDGDGEGEGAGEEAEGEAGEGQDGEAQITQNASMEELPADGDGEEEGDDGDGTKSPKKKKASRSVSKGKKKSKSDADTMNVVKQKEVVKTNQKDGGKGKKKWVLDETVETPQEILDWIEEHHRPEETGPEEEAQEAKDGKEKKAKTVTGVDLIAATEVRRIVEEKYFMMEKKRLVRITEANKAKTNLTILAKMLLHMALNIGPQAKVNEDIEEQLKDGVQNLVLQAQGSLVSASSPAKEPRADEPPKEAAETTTGQKEKEMAATQEIKPQAEAGTRSQKSGGSLHPSQCSRKSKKKQEQDDQKSQQSKQSQKKEGETKELDNVFVTEPIAVQQPDQAEQA